jgi:hypothetical protein
MGELLQEMESLVDILAPYVEKHLKMSAIWCRHNNPCSKLRQILDKSVLDQLNAEFGDQESALDLLRRKVSGVKSTADAAESGATSSTTE